MMGWYGRVPPPVGFWAEKCPARSADLVHKHDKDCTDGHTSDQCCECGRHAADWQAAVPPPDIADHIYMWTIVGKCMRCQRTPDVHPTMLEKRLSQDECAVDHNSLSPARLINDGGIEWRRCPVCNAMAEPKLATGLVSGPITDPGRGDLIPRQAKRVVNWKGWIKFLAAKGVIEGDDYPAV